MILVHTLHGHFREFLAPVSPPRKSTWKDVRARHRLSRSRPTCEASHPSGGGQYVFFNTLLTHSAPASQRQHSGLQWPQYPRCPERRLRSRKGRGGASHLLQPGKAKPPAPPPQGRPRWWVGWQARQHIRVNMDMPSVSIGIDLGLRLPRQPWCKWESRARHMAELLPGGRTSINNNINPYYRWRRTHTLEGPFCIRYAF